MSDKADASPTGHSHPAFLALSRRPLPPWTVVSSNLGPLFKNDFSVVTKDPRPLGFDIKTGLPFPEPAPSSASKYASSSTRSGYPRGVGDPRYHSSGSVQASRFDDNTESVHPSEPKSVGSDGHASCNTSNTLKSDSPLKGTGTATDNDNTRITEFGDRPTYTPVEADDDDPGHQETNADTSSATATASDLGSAFAPFPNAGKSTRNASTQTGAQAGRSS